MYVQQPAVGTKRKAEHVEGEDAAPEVAPEDGAPDEAPPPKVSVELDEPLVLGPKTFTHTGDVYKYFGALLSTWTMHQTFNEVRASVAPTGPCQRSRHPACRRLCTAPNASWLLLGCCAQYEHMVLEQLLRRGHPNAEGKVRRPGCLLRAARRHTLGR